MDDALGYGNFQFIKEEILIPLNLNNTFASLSEFRGCDEWLSCRISS